jgi:ATP-dependent DNA helicase DinG
VPALLAGGKVILSTGTKTLQDQLYDRDLPAVRSALASGATIALLKGRANYVCVYRLRRAEREARLSSPEEATQLRTIARFAAVSSSGDRADLATVPEDAPVWQHATSTRENCLGQECPDYGECFVMRARRDALAADLVVVNHHLFFADVVLRDGGVAELLPACNTIVFDEAHQLPETARNFFGEILSTTQMIELARDTRLELRAAGGASPELESLAQRLERGARDLRLSLGSEPARMAWAQAARRDGFAAALETLSSALDALAEALEEQGARSEGLASCARRAEESRATLARVQEPPRGPRALDRGLQPRRAAPQHAALLGGAFQAPVRRSPARLDLHFGDARGRRRFLAFPARARARGKRHARLGEPVRLCDAGASIPAARVAGGSE